MFVISVHGVSINNADKKKQCCSNTSETQTHFMHLYIKTLTIQKKQCWKNNNGCPTKAHEKTMHNLKFLFYFNSIIIQMIHVRYVKETLWRNV